VVIHYRFANLHIGLGSDLEDFGDLPAEMFSE